VEGRNAEDWKRVSTLTSTSIARLCDQAEMQSIRDEREGVKAPDEKKFDEWIDKKSGAI